MGPAKLQKAQKLGITILSEKEFMALISAAGSSVAPQHEEPTPATENTAIQGTLF
jgi:BRCT domain type II-containing protein